MDRSLDQIGPGGRPPGPTLALTWTRFGGYIQVRADKDIPHSVEVVVRSRSAGRPSGGQPPLHLLQCPLSITWELALGPYMYPHPLIRTTHTTI
jgi:hypothetical protein